MAFDPTKPANNSPNSSLEMRNQLNALKALIDAQAEQISTLTQQLSSRPTMDDVNAAINANSAANPSDITYTQMVPSDPPTQSDLQTVIYLLNSLITATTLPLISTSVTYIGDIVELAGCNRIRLTSL